MRRLIVALLVAVNLTGAVAAAVVVHHTMKADKSDSWSMRADSDSWS